MVARMSSGVTGRSFTNDPCLSDAPTMPAGPEDPAFSALDGGTARAQRVRRVGTDTAAPTKIDFWMSVEADRAPVVIRFEDDDGRALRFVRA